MNRQQKAYALAKAHLDTCKELLQVFESRWMQQRGITNPDGTTPKELYMLDCDEAEFDRLGEAIAAEPEHERLWRDQLDARKLLDDAENALIDYGLSIAPAGVRETLNANRKRLAVREKLIDLAFWLDTRTVKRA